MIESKRFLTEGMAISLFTLLSYIIAYRFESGFCNYWHIPNFFIEVSITTILNAALSLFSFSLMIFIFLNALFGLFGNPFNQTDSLRNRFIIVHLFYSVFLLVILVAYGLSITFFLLLFIVLLLDFTSIIVPWYIDKKEFPEKTAFFGRLERSFIEEEKGNSILDTISSKFGAKVALMLALLPIIVNQRRKMTSQK